MNGIRIGSIAFTLGLLLPAAGCNGGTTTSTPTQPSNISGDYTGTVQDAQLGSSAATATLAQHGTSAGGTITIASSGGALNAQISLVITTSNALSGAIVIDEPNGTTCTFGTTGTYSPSTNVINGSYSAVTNCSGETGTYALTQQCLDTVTAVERRKMGLTHC